MLADLNVLFGRVIRIADSSPQGRFVGPLTHPIDGRIAVQGLMRAMPIVMVDPQRELVANIAAFGSVAAQNSSRVVRCARSTFQFR